MNSPGIKKLLKKHSDLFWYTPGNKKEVISKKFLVETTIMGIEKVADVFFNTINRSNRRKGNYHEITVNYFTLVFNRYAKANN